MNVPDVTEHQKQLELIVQCARSWYYHFRDGARESALHFTDSRKLVRLYNALMQPEPNSILRYRMILDAWDDLKGAAMRACRTSFDTWGDIEKMGREGSEACLSLVKLKEAIEKPELLEALNNL